MDDRTHGERYESASTSFGFFVPEAEPDRAAASFARRYGALGAFAFETVGAMWDRPQLSRRDRSLLVVSTLATQARDDELSAHTQIGLRHGLVRSEIEEILPHVAALAGFPAAMAASRSIDAGLREFEGVDRLSPREGIDALDDAERDARAAEIDPSGPVGELGHLGELWWRWNLGEIWSRPQLGRRDRSIVTLSILTTLGADRPLVDAADAARANGLSAVEIDEVVTHLGLYTGLVRATEAWERIGSPNV